MSGKQAWSEWSHELAKSSGKCVGICPSMGLPSDLVSMEEFQTSIASLPVHDVRTCSCWGTPITKPDKTMGAPPRVADLAASNTTPELMVQNTEAVVRGRVLQTKTMLKDLIDKISVDDFRLESGTNRVIWSHHLPPTLMTMMGRLPEFLRPPSSVVKDDPVASAPLRPGQRIDLPGLSRRR
jgi:hypothetical protein